MAIGAETAFATIPVPDSATKLLPEVLLQNIVRFPL
jgi:hypothetical protein